MLLKGNYGPLLPYLVQMHIDQLVLEMATPRAGELDVFKEYANEKELGLGVVNPRTDEIESPAMIVQRVKQVLKFSSRRRSISTLIAASGLSPSVVSIRPRRHIASSRPSARRQRCCVRNLLSAVPCEHPL